MRNFVRELDNPGMEYRPRNYWGWLENIMPDEVRWQIREMAKAGLGGYVMHARGGLTIPYAGKEWMDGVRAMIEEGRALGMKTIVDDEHGWPSGFGAGKVNGKGEKYQLKYLKCEIVETGAPERPHTLGTWERDGRLLRVYAEIDPYYVDNMDPDVVDAFLEASYEDYNREVGSDFGEGVYGIFSDEPQTARYATPWSDILPELFEKEYGYPLLPELNKVFENCPGCEQLRHDLYALMAKCFTENYAGRIHRWCEAHGVKFMGHTCLEDDFAGQLRCAISTMPFYEHMSEPGMDWLCRVRLNNMTILQLTSAAQQTGKKRVLSEMFGCAGWSVTPEELKWIAQWQHALGINDQLQHLGLYSLRGSRKREYPASIFYQQPWFAKMKPYNDYFARVSKLVAESKQETDLLVLHPMRTAWVRYDGTEDSLREMTKSFTGLLDELLGAGLTPHLGDETLMRLHGRVVGKQLEIGACRYGKVLIPPVTQMEPFTVSLLREFTQAGGGIYALDDSPAAFGLPYEKVGPRSECLASSPRLAGGNGMTYVARWNWRGQRFLYVTNNDLNAPSDFALKIDEDSSLYAYDPMENRLDDVPVDETRLHLEGGEAMILFCGEKAAPKALSEAEYAHSLTLDGAWRIERVGDNALTLDRCAVSVDGAAFGEEEYVLDVQKRLMKAGRDCDVAMKFRFTSEFETDLFLLAENPEKCSVRVNGAPAGQSGIWRVDKCLEALPIHAVRGENEIVIQRRFENDERVYYVKNHAMHEAESNRVTVNTELESVYLWGRFAVRAEVLNENGPRRTVETAPKFRIAPLPQEADISRLEREGFLFFAGEITLSRTFRAEADGEALIHFRRPDAGVTEVELNGETKTLLWAPYECRMPVCKGENVLRVTLTNSCRNLFGPHYRKDGDPYTVGPFSFGMDKPNPSFVRFGIEGGVELQFLTRGDGMILICGLNGSGKSTLGRALAAATGVRFLDSEELFFPQPVENDAYGKPVSREEAVAHLTDEARAHPDLVFAAVRGDYGKAILSLYSCAILVEVPREERLRRVRERSFAKFGARMLPGGDLHENEERFFRMVEERAEDHVESWIRTLPCPVIRIDGTKPVAENVALLRKRLQK